VTGGAGRADTTPRRVPRPPGGRPTRWLVLAGVALVLATPIAVWWMVGDRTTTSALLGATWRGRFPATWWGVLVPLLVAGAFCGAGWRVITAGVVGANIGGGLLLVSGVPIVVTLIGVAVVVAWSLRRQRRHPGSSA
jgi:hypothetical protein